MKLSSDDYMKYLFENIESIKHVKPPTPKEEAIEILKKLDDNPEIFKEFNLLLRLRKINKIKNGRKI